MSSMGQKCLSQGEVSQVYILLWLKLHKKMFQHLLLMEILREYNMVKNNKKWGGLFNQLLWLLLIMSEYLLKI
jgi:hypothetical protein